jgi:hypothetical protein
MKRGVFVHAFIFIMMMTCMSCVKNESTTVDLESDKQYYPLSVGKYRDYVVDSILYRQGRFLDSVHTLIHEEILDKYRDTIGDVFTISRSIRKKAVDPWLRTATYTVRLHQNKIIYNVANLNFIPLTFPIRVPLQWDGLAMINTDQSFDVNGENMAIYQNWDIFKIKEAPKTEKIGSSNFNSVVTIIQTDVEDIVSRRYAVEKYAKGIGLVFKEMMVLDCNNTVNPCATNVPWDKRATKGFVLRQTITQFN